MENEDKIAVFRDWKISKESYSLLHGVTFLMDPGSILPLLFSEKDRDLSFEIFESFFGLLFNDQARKMIFISLMIRLLFNDQACFMKVRGKGGEGRGNRV